MNNSSERDLRNSVIHDKGTGGYRSRRGAEQGATFATLLNTGRKVGQCAYERLSTIPGPSPLQAAGQHTYAVSAVYERPPERTRAGFSTRRVWICSWLRPPSLRSAAKWVGM